MRITGCGILIFVGVVLPLSSAAGQSRSSRQASARTSASLPSMAVVVESTGGLAMARQVRALLAADAGIPVKSLEAFVADGERPDLVLTVTISGGQDIHVMYWDRLGAADALAAPVPKADSVTSVVAASLATALVRRNLPALTAALRADPVYPHYGGRGRSRSALSSLSPVQLRQLLSRLSPHYGGRGRSRNALSSLSPVQLRQLLSRLSERSPRSDVLTDADF